MARRSQRANTAKLDRHPRHPENPCQIKGCRTIVRAGFVRISRPEILLIEPLARKSMHTRTRKLLLVSLVLGCSVLEAAATSYELPPYHNWTFRVGSREFGFKGYSPEGYPPPSFSKTYTVIHYGFRKSSIRRPVHVVAAVFGTLLLLVCVGCLLIARRRNENAA